MAEMMTANGLVVGLIVEPEEHKAVKKVEKNAAPAPTKAKASAKASKE